MEFAKVLNSYHTNAANYTHTRIKGGKYNIPQAEMSDFYKKLYQHVIVDGHEIDLLEKRPEGDYKLTLDFDIKYSNIPDKREVSTSFMKKLATATIKFMKELLELSDEDGNNDDSDVEINNLLECYVLRRPQGYSDNNIYKDGLHLQFPNIITEKKYHNIIVNRLRDSENIQKLFSTFTCDSKELKDILDIPASVKNFWFVYGCTKVKTQAYRLEFIMNGLGEIDSEKTEKYHQNPYKLMKKLSFYFENENAVNLNILDQYLEKPKQKEEVFTNKSGELGSLDMEKYDMLLEILDKKIWDEYDAWFRIGAALYNTHPELLTLYKKFSKLSKKYQSGCCEKNWETYAKYDPTKEKITIASIKEMAQKCDEAKYLAWSTKYDGFDKLINRAIHDKCHEDFAKILYKLCQNEYIYSDNAWYEYRPEKNRWKKIKDLSAIALKKKLREINELIFISKRMQSGEENPDSDDESEDESDGDSKSKKATSQKKKGKSKEDKERIKYSEASKLLKNSGYKTAVINECKELFYHDDFTELTDMNDFIIGFNNGVLDLKSCSFRAGHPTDYVTFSTGYDYALEDDVEVQKELMSIITDIIPNETERNFVLTLFASTLEANNTNELFPCLEGSGGNGKSFITDLHAYSLGDYAGVLNNNYLTNTFNSPENHNTMLYNNYKKRFLQVNEPSNKKELNLNVIKELTGGDKMQLRAAHSAETITVQPKFKLFCLFNKTPKIEDTTDGGFLRRFVGIKFPNKFVENPTKSNERKKDENLKLKVKTSVAFHQQWMRIMLKYYKKYLEGGRKLSIPDSIKKNSKQLINDQDPVSDFIDGMLVITKNLKNTITLKDIYAEFTGYCQKNYQTKPVQRKELLSRLLEIWDKMIDAEEIKYEDEYKKKKNVFLGVELKKEEIIMSDSE